MNIKLVHKYDVENIPVELQSNAGILQCFITFTRCLDRCIDGPNIRSSSFELIRTREQVNIPFTGRNGLPAHPAVKRVPGLWTRLASWLFNQYL